MSYPKALAMFWRSLGTGRTSSRVPEPVPAVCCRHCGGTRLKLSYRRRDKSTAPSGDADAEQTVFIFRCAGCEGFTTVNA